MLHRSVLLLSLLAISVSAGVSEQRTRRRGPVVRQVDRIQIESSDPKALFDFLADTLGLSVAWPISEHPSYISGCVSTGDVNFELYRYVEGKDPARSGAAARFTGLALEPYPLEDSLQELQIAEIPYSPPQAHESTLPDGTRGLAWTTVALPSLSSPGLSVFLYKYSTRFLDVTIRRRQLGNRLTLKGGGPLGVEAVHEIVLETTNWDEDRAEWAPLLSSADTPGRYRAVQGPAIRLRRGNGDRIHKVVLKVVSLDRERAFLEKRRLLGSTTPAEIFLRPSGTQGLNLSLVEEK
jgi:hypothetical protein